MFKELLPHFNPVLLDPSSIMLSLLPCLSILLLSLTGAMASLPNKIYGVNIGGWFVSLSFINTLC